MIRTASISCALCAAIAIGSRTAAHAASPVFLAVDIHPSPQRLHPHIHGHSSQDRATLRDASLTDLIVAAYQVQPVDILGGPAWLDFNRFDINAKAPAGTKFSNQDDDPAETAMLRAMLADRFGLVVKTEKRDLPAFVLTVDKPGKMKAAADPDKPAGCRMTAAANTNDEHSQVHLTCNNFSADDLPELLTNVGGSYFNRPLVDQTHLKGKWDIDLEYNYDKPTSGGTSLPDALEKQLGLKVELKPVPTPVVVITTVNQQPTPNLPGLDKILPPPPPARFDVAVIRPASPDEKHYNLDITQTRVTIQAASLQTLIYKSFDMPPGMIENKPKWLDDAHWDITGTYSSDSAAPTHPGDDPTIDEEDEKEMVRSLLADRFGLLTHAGTRPATVFALTVANPKLLKPAADTEHPGCAEGPGPDGKDPRVANPLRDRLLTCQNMTMAEFATELHQLVSGYVPAPVIDKTGVTGGYDFSLSFSRAGKLNAATASPSSSGPAAAGVASDPNAGGLPPMSLFDALEKQAGLKLEKRDKVDMPTLVIDHIEDHPTDN
jgi:uncharacterized protein (TIGR03435 family)